MSTRSSSSRHELQARSKLFALPTPVWGLVTAYLTSEEIASFSATTPFVRNFLRSPHVVNRLHIHLRSRSNLKLVTFPHHWYATYPTLTSIGLTFRKQGQSGLVMSPTVLAQLPASLRHLHLNYADTINDHLVAHLPRHLLTLHLELNSSISTAGIRDLPEWLETLYLPHNHNLTSHCISLLPKTLRNLTFQTIDEISESLMREMPPLTSLTVTGDSRVPGPSLAAMPRSLTCFRWQTSQFMESYDVELLPSSIREFSVSKLAAADESISKLSRDLQRLTITHTIHLSKAGIESLPPRLVYLEFSHQKTLPEGTIAALPRQLHSLSLPLIKSLTLDQIKELPRTLNILNIKSVTSLNDDWFAHLPPRIHFISLTWNDGLTEDLIQFATPFLARLEMRASFLRNFDYSEDYVLQPVDAAFPSVQALLAIRSTLATSRGAPFETFLFEVNAAKRKMIAIDVFPKSEFVWREPPPVKNWFQRLFNL